MESYGTSPCGPLATALGRQLKKLLIGLTRSALGECKSFVSVTCGFQLPTSCVARRSNEGGSVSR